MKHIIVIGAGAAGLTASIFASKNAKVTILEKTEMTGKKILVSGGSRCNVLPENVNYDDYFTSSSKNIMKNIFKSWSLEECKKWFNEELGLDTYVEKETGKVFPKSNSSKEVRDVLLKKAHTLGVKVFYDSHVEKIYFENNYWFCKTKNNSFKADAIIVATGGLSIPKLGTTGDGQRFLKEIGHKINRLYPALTPLKGIHPNNEMLAGISLDVEMNIKLPSEETKKNKKKQSNRNGFLFTHKGFSGPSILDISHYSVLALEEKKFLPEININWLGYNQEKWKEILTNENILVLTKLKNYLPTRLAIALCNELEIENTKLNELKKEKRNKLIENLTNYKLLYNGHEGYLKAEVTGGGIPLEEIDSSSLESKIHKKLFLCGEILDVFGRIGGFNFYWAWVTGRLAGLSAIK
ncbi:MAG: aminoacetone oxidase family FAD-binding enzyme [Candidatus Sericytochromatia bacterium]